MLIRLNNLSLIVCFSGISYHTVQNLARVDLDTASWLFTAWSFGYILGSLVSGLIYDRYRKMWLLLHRTP